MSILIYPVNLLVIGAELAGCKYEIQPLLLEYFTENYTQEELNSFGEKIMYLIGDKYMFPKCGSAFWVVYKNICKKDIKKLIDCVSTEEKLQETQELLLKSLNP